PLLPARRPAAATAEVRPPQGWRQGRLDHPRGGIHRGAVSLHPSRARSARGGLDMIGRILGLGSAARGVGEAIGGVAEVFIGNRAEREAGEQERFNRVVAQFGEEFTRPVCGRFDGFVNGLNRLPRPMMALGTLVLFVYAMVDPPGFSTRMQGLGHVPEPLW